MRARPVFVPAFRSGRLQGGLKQVGEGRVLGALVRKSLVWRLQILVALHPIRRDARKRILGLHLTGFNLSAHVSFEVVFQFESVVRAVPRVLNRLIPEVRNIVAASGTQGIKMVNFAGLDVPGTLENVVLVVNLGVLGCRNVPMVLGVRARGFPVRTVVGVGLCQVGETQGVGFPWGEARIWV